MQKYTAHIIISAVSLIIGLYAGLNIKPSKDIDHPAIVQQQASKCEIKAIQSKKPDGTITNELVFNAETKSGQSIEPKNNDFSRKESPNNLIILDDAISYSYKVAELKILKLQIEFAPVIEARKDNSIHFGGSIRW